MVFECMIKGVTGLVCLDGVAFEVIQMWFGALYSV
jgi:hypothetical protein